MKLCLEEMFPCALFPMTLQILKSTLLQEGFIRYIPLGIRCSKDPNFLPIVQMRVSVFVPMYYRKKKMTEKDTNQRVKQNAIRRHFIAKFI